VAFTRSLIQGFRAGSNLVAPPDQIPDGAFRVLENARLSRSPGEVGNRPGMTEVTTSAVTSDVVYSLWTLFQTLTSAVRYAHVGTSLYRMTQTWGTPVEIATGIGRGPVSAVNMVDGENGLSTYLTNTSGLGSKRDDGTTLHDWGVPPVTERLPAPELATDLFTQIDVMDVAANWTVTSGLSAGPTAEANIKQQGAASITITVAANTLGTIARSLTTPIDLDTLVGGDEDVKLDDYIHLWVRADRPARVNYLQIDVDLDTLTVADAFRTNMYSIQLPGLVWLNQGAQQWSRVQVPKSAFTRVGENMALSWANASSVRLSVQTTTDGPCQLYLDDFKLRGGTDIVGRVRYSAVYRNAMTGGKGNPHMTDDNRVIYSPRINVDRQRVNVPTTPIRYNGPAYPTGAAITHLIMYRSIDGGEAVEIDRILIAELSPFLDDVSVVSTLLKPTLETDNNPPPEGHVVFGPGALNRVFLLRGDNDLYYSKAWEVHENRAENWPTLFHAQIGDGSEKAQTGIVTDTTILVWSDQQTYMIQGSGDDTFLPMVIPNSRGVVSRFCVAQGDGSLFFVSQDGVYEQVGLQQRRLTDAIAPFFAGLEVSGVPGWNTDPAVLRSVRLSWQADALGPFLLMLYPSRGQLLPDRELYLGRNAVTGRYTDVSFDRRGSAGTLRSLYRDPEQNWLYGGSSGGRIFHLEDASVDTDDGQAMAWRLVTRSEHFDTPNRDKYLTQAIVEMDTALQPIHVDALYDKQRVREALSPVLQTTGPTGQGLLLVADPEAPRQDVALELTGLVDTRVSLSRYGWFQEAQPELLTFWDSGKIVLAAQTVLQGVWYTLQSTALVTVTVYREGHVTAVYGIPSTIGRRLADRFFFVAGTKSREVRITFSSTAGFRLYACDLRSKPYGSDQGYQPQPLVAAGS
jgi:hypothetical protein